MRELSRVGPGLPVSADRGGNDDPPSREEAARSALGAGDMPVDEPENRLPLGTVEDGLAVRADGETFHVRSDGGE